MMFELFELGTVSASTRRVLSMDAQRCLLNIKVSLRVARIRSVVVIFSQHIGFRSVVILLWNMQTTFFENFEVIILERPHSHLRFQSNQRRCPVHVPEQASEIRLSAKQSEPEQKFERAE